MDLRAAVLSAPDSAIRNQTTPSRIAVVAGIVFFFAGLVKFVFHHWELHAFQTFGLPYPAALEIVAGIVETAGGVFLMLRYAIVPATILLASTMVVAIAASGIGHGDVIPSLTLAPVLLAAVVYLLGTSLAPEARDLRSAEGRRE